MICVCGKEVKKRYKYCSHRCYTDNNKGENNSFYGQSHTTEYKTYMSELKKDVPLGEEHKKKLSKSHGDCSGKNNGLIVKEFTTVQKHLDLFINMLKGEGKYAIV